MNSCLVKLCIFLFLTVEGTQGLELTINMRKNDTVTLVCSSSEDLEKCSCPSHPQNCQRCTHTALNSPYELFSSEKHFKLSGLKYSGLYVCTSLSVQKIGRKYRINVVEDHQDSNVVIGGVGQTVIISCGTEPDIMAASEKHWCRLSSAKACQPDTVMGLDNDSSGDFKILHSHGSFSLEKQHLMHDDAGFYRFTQLIQNQTKVCEVDLQIKDKPSFLEIGPTRVNDHLQITCQYSQDLQGVSKSWLCDNSECDETVTSVEERSQSALVLTVDHVACSNIRSFQCVAKMSQNSVKSQVYSKPLKRNPIVEAVVSPYRSSKRVMVKAYSQLKLICFQYERNAYDYEMYSMGRWRMDDFYYRATPQWCKVIHTQCVPVKENVRVSRSSATLEICVTPNDQGTKYRCPTNRWNPDVEIDVIAPPPPPPPRAVTDPTGPIIPDTGFGTTTFHVGIIIMVTVMTLLVILLCITVTTFKGPKLRERLLARTTPLSAVDVHANLYANSVAHYYSNNRQQVPQPDKEGEEDDKDTASSLDDEFEELPIAPKMSSSIMPEETDYIRVKPGGAGWSQNVQALQRDSEQFGQGRPLPRSYDHVSGPSDGSGHGDEDDDDVTYTHVIIKPKHKHK